VAMRQDRTSFAENIRLFLRVLGKPFFLALLLIFMAGITITFFLIKSFIQLNQAFIQRLRRQKNNFPQFTFKLPSLKLKRPSLSHIKKPKLPIIVLPPIPTLSLPFRIKINIRFISVGLILVVIAGTLFAFYFFIIKDLPHPKNLINRKQAVTTKIYDRNHQLLYKFYKNENRSIIKLDDIPSHVIQATLAIEDSDFYQHAGFSLRGITRAFKRNIFEQRLQGGSTITQQLVKNALLTSEKTLARKVKELILALAVENYFTKNEILTMYFNEVGYGGPAYGVEEASQTYFGKSAKSLNLAEAALLAGLPASPTIYSPFGARPELAVARQHEVLRRMVEEQYITVEEAEQAKSFELNFASPTIDILAPHFVMYVKDLLVSQYGEQAVNQGGLEVVTSLDLNVQKMAEAAVQGELERLKLLKVNNASVVVTHPQSGEVLAMVGSANYFDTQHDGQVNVSLRPRQPGSSIKPLTYALAFESGLTPATLIEDSPVIYRVPGSPPYAPKNYDGNYHGRVTLRLALASSYNIPAVKLLSQIGVSKMVARGNDLGITTWDNPQRFGLSLTLGGGEVRLVDMAVLYGTFANAGMKVDLHPIISVTDYAHRFEDHLSCAPYSSTFTGTNVQAAANTSECTGEQVIKPEIAFLISDILSDNDARTPAFGRHSVLNLEPFDVAVKTGTTNSLRDNWTIGYTPEYVVGVWVGNNDNTPMSYVASGITGASPIFSTIMKGLLSDQEAKPNFIPPDNIIAVSVCATTGTLSCQNCPQTRTEFFIKGTEPKNPCNLTPDPSTQPTSSPPVTDTPSRREQILDGLRWRKPNQR